MNKLYPFSSYKNLVILALMVLSCGNVFAFDIKPKISRDSAKVQSKPNLKITDTRKEKPASKLKVNLVPFKPTILKANNTQATNKTFGTQDEKILSNVKVYPNPVSDQINVNYFVSKDVNVTIKIMDFLGNEVATLFSQRMIVGEQNSTFNISSKLNSGLYFIRFIAGNETVIKRISVL